MDILDTTAMKLLCLAICCILSVESQLSTRKFDYSDTGKIYFEDDGAKKYEYTINKRTTPVTPTFYTTRRNVDSKFDIQASVQTTSEIDKQMETIQYDYVEEQETKPGQFISVSPERSNVAKNFHIGPASTDFGVNVFKQISKEQGGNLVVSPYSITILLALLQQGASGGTLDQITNALQMTPEASAEVYKQVTENILKRNSRNILKSANNIFLSSSFNLNSDFKRIAVNNFGSDLTPANFANAEKAAADINAWVADNTNNKIQNLIPPNALSAITEMVMVNAVYFKGLWEIPFREQATIERPFHLENGKTKPAKFMRTRRYFKAGVDKTSNAKVIALPFEFNEFSYIIILPHESSDVNAVLSTLKMSDVASYLDFPPKDVELEIPKFSIRADTDLKPVLTKMGVSSIFTQQSELYKLGTSGSLSPEVSSALHSAVLTIDEKGGSAAAATSFAVVALSYDDPSLFFRANKPFIGILWDNKLSVPLFMARVMDPTVQ